MRNILLIVFMAAAFSSQSQTLFTYGTAKVDQKEFWRAYSKNNNGATDEKSIREYLDLFIRFKLKVQAAKDAKLDTLPAIKNDIAGFRAQILEQFLRNQSTGKDIITEAVERSKTEIEAAHIFVAYDKDSTKAKAQIDKAYQQLQSGADFKKLARELSTNAYVLSTEGYIGYVSVFSLPYNLETILYALPAGSYSKPVAGINGYHILKVMSKRNSAGTLKVAQILIATPANATVEEIAAAKTKAQTVYQLAKKGDKFEDLALQYSEDKMTFQNGGLLPDFSFTKFDATFSKAAFGLQKDGDISEPVQTSAGFHIINRISLTPVKTDISDPLLLQEYTDKVSNDSRINIANARMKEQMQKASGYKALPYNEQQLWTLTDTMLKAKNYASFFKANQQKPLFLLKDKTVTVSDWLRFVKSQQTNPNAKLQLDYKNVMKQFVETTAEQYYKDRLETMNEDFRYQIKEFSEGSLLFEVMERKIWSVAPADSAGLVTFYKANKTKYKWQPSVNAIVFNCSDTSVANRALLLMKKDPLKWKDYMEGFNGTALADSGRFEFNQLPVTEQRDFKTGAFTPVVTNTNDGSSSFCYIVKVYNTEDQRSFDEAKGLVINDYQLLLEEQWISQLKKKYPVKVNEAVVKGMVK